MNTQVAPVILSFIGPVLALMLFFAAVSRRCGLNPRGAGWCVGLALVSFGLLLIPVAGLPLARVVAAVMDHWSVPLLALLTACAVKTFFSVELFRREDNEAISLFGVIVGAVLYPLALGIGSTDPFAYGWHFGPMFVIAGVAAVMLQWRGNRLGWLLLLALLLCQIGAVESGNLWDCLIDPVFFFISIGVSIRLAWRRKSFLRKT